MQRMNVWTPALGLLFLGACVLGCTREGTARTAKVTGTVSYNGTPLEGANVTFTPANGRPGTGTTDASGKFSVSTFSQGDGAVPGNHVVTITDAAPSAPEPMPGTPEAENYQPPKPRFPAKYSDPSTTTFKFEVKKGEKNNFTLEMTD